MYKNYKKQDGAADMAEENVVVKEFEFPSNSAYTTIHGKFWIPQGDIKCVLQISHGMSEYIDRYDEFARYLAARGILVVGNDHMGHGDSINSKDEFGYFAPKEWGVPRKEKGERSSSYYTVKDLLEVTKLAKKEAPGVPYVLLGHSMGSFLARRYMMEYGEEIDGAIIMGTGNQPKPLLNTAIGVSNFLRAARGPRHRSKAFAYLMFGSYNKKIEDSNNPYDWVTSDEEKLEKYNSDERSGFLFTMNGIETLLATIKYIQKERNIANIPKDIKMFFVSGEEDPVGEYGKQVEFVYNQYKEAGIKDISIKLYPGCRHEILNEVNRQEVYEDLYNWLLDNFIK